MRNRIVVPNGWRCYFSEGQWVEITTFECDGKWRSGIRTEDDYRESVVFGGKEAAYRISEEMWQMYSTLMNGAEPTPVVAQFLRQFGMNV